MGNAVWISCSGGLKLKEGDPATEVDERENEKIEKGEMAIKFNWGNALEFVCMEFLWQSSYPAPLSRSQVSPVQLSTRNTPDGAKFIEAVSAFFIPTLLSASIPPNFTSRPSPSCPVHYAPITMSGRQGGKAKPLKAPKKKAQDVDEDDAAFKAKQKADAAAKKAMAEKAKKGGPMVGGGIKKSGKK